MTGAQGQRSWVENCETLFTQPASSRRSSSAKPALWSDPSLTHPLPTLLFVRNFNVARTACGSYLPAPTACELLGSIEGLWFNWVPTMPVTISTSYL